MDFALLSSLNTLHSSPHPQEVAKDALLLPRSGAFMAPLPPGHAQAAVMIGGYVEAPDKSRAGTAEVWAYGRDGQWTLVPTGGGPAPQVCIYVCEGHTAAVGRGSRHRHFGYMLVPPSLTKAPSCPLSPHKQTQQPRLAAQAVLAGGAVWLIGGWNPAVQGPDAFLSDVWRLDVDAWKWEQVEPQV
jgi:hypothetical protein